MECLISRASVLSDSVLAAEVSRLAHEERQTTAQLVAALAEFDARRLYLPAGCASLFTYCTQVLHLSEHAAYNRIEVARAVRRYPAILERFAAGELTLTVIRLLSPCLTTANHLEVLQAARHKSKREVEHLVAALRPQDDVPASIRQLPTRRVASATPALLEQSTDRTSGHVAPVEQTAREGEPNARPVAPPLASSAPHPRGVVMPIAPLRYKVQLTISRETHDKLRRAQELLRHVVPNGDPAAVVDRALTLLVAEFERRKLAVVQTQRRRSESNAHKRSRYIPAAVRREVWARDAGQCAFIGTAGRCAERGLLEFHHVVPYAEGGETTADNLELRCRRHNEYEAERWFGAAEIPSATRESRSAWPGT